MYVSSFFLLSLFLSKTRSMLLRDLQSVVLYDQEGKFAGIRRPSSKLPIEIDGTKIVIVDAIGSSGLDLKVMALQLIYFIVIFTFIYSYGLMKLFRRPILVCLLCMPALVR